MFCTVKVDEGYTHYLGIQLDSSYENAGQDMPVTGTIVSNPESLPYMKAEWDKWKSHPFRNPFITKRLHYIDVNTMPWETTIETKEGDKVWFFYRGLGERDNNGNCPIKYEHLYCKQTDQGLYMLNGWVGIEIIEDEQMFYGQKIQTGQQKGVVVALGEPLKSYKDYPHIDTATLKIGDSVVFHTKFAFLMEAKVHNRTGKDIYLVQRKEIFGYERT